VEAASEAIVTDMMLEAAIRTIGRSEGRMTRSLASETIGGIEIIGTRTAEVAGVAEEEMTGTAVTMTAIKNVTTKTGMADSAIENL